MKECCRCRESKPLDQFKRNRVTPDGYNRECRACCKVRYEANAEKNRAYAREYYWRNPEPYRERAKLQRQTPEHQEAERRLAEARAGRLPENPTPGELRARDWYVRYRAENAEKYRESNRRWVARNPDRARMLTRAWRIAHPEYSNRSGRIRKAREIASGKRFTAAEWQALKSHYGYRCLCCGKTEPEIKLTPDHVIPVAKEGPNSIDNIQPLCFSCNSRKRDNTTDYRPPA